MIAALGYVALAAFQYAAGQAQAESMRENGEFAQRVADKNAEYAELDAFEAEAFGYTQSARYQNVISSTISEQNVINAVNDVDDSTGTAAAIKEESRLTGILNTLDIEAEGRARARGFKREASQIRIGAAQTRAQANINANATETQAIVSAAGYGLRAYSAARSEGLFDKKDKMSTKARTGGMSGGWDEVDEEA